MAGHEITSDSHTTRVKARGWGCSHVRKYPVLVSLDQDYLNCAVSSAVAKQICLAAADVCWFNRGGLDLITFEQCVISRMWVQSGVTLKGAEVSDLSDIIKSIEPLPLSLSHSSQT